MSTEVIDATMRPVLSPEELKMLSARVPWRAMLGIARVYGLLILTIGLALTFGGWWMVPAFVIVAALQHAISILQHEAVHGLLFHSHRLNDVVGRYLLSYPIGFSMDYRIVHFAHHRHLGQEADPDLHNYRPFPASPRKVWLKIIRECSGWGAVMQFLGRGASTSGARSRLVGVAAAQFVILGLFFIAGHPFAYLWLWLLPLVTLAKGFAQLRNLAEHFIREDAPIGSERLRTFQSSPFERFFLAPLNFHYHAEHHWYTTVPYYNLPALRAVLRTREGYKEHAAWTPGYLWVLSRLARRTNAV
jgi:fatty acid desaturase